MEYEGGGREKRIDVGGGGVPRAGVRRVTSHVQKMSISRRETKKLKVL